MSGLLSGPPNFASAHTSLDKSYMTAPSVRRARSARTSRDKISCNKPFPLVIRFNME